MFWPLQLSSEVSGVPEDSQVPISKVWVSSSHSSKSGVATFHVSLVVKLLLLICVQTIDDHCSIIWTAFNKFTIGINVHLIQCSCVCMKLSYLPTIVRITWNCSILNFFQRANVFNIMYKVKQVICKPLLKICQNISFLWNPMNFPFGEALEFFASKTLMLF